MAGISPCLVEWKSIDFRFGRSGTIHDVIEYQEYQQRRTTKGELVHMEGLKRLDIVGGGRLRRLDATSFKVVSTGEIARLVIAR